MITYGAMAGSKRTNLAISRANLSKIQRCACMTGTLTTCPTVAVEAVLNLNPSHILVEIIVKKDTRKKFGARLVRHTPHEGDKT